MKILEPNLRFSNKLTYRTGFILKYYFLGVAFENETFKRAISRDNRHFFGRDWCSWLLTLISLTLAIIFLNLIVYIFSKNIPSQQDLLSEV